MTETDIDEIEQIVFFAFQECVLAWIVQHKFAGKVGNGFFMADYAEAWAAVDGSGLTHDVPRSTRVAQLKMSDHVRDLVDDRQPMFFMKSESIDYLKSIDLKDQSPASGNEGKGFEPTL